MLNEHQGEWKQDEAKSEKGKNVDSDIKKMDVLRGHIRMSSSLELLDGEG